MSPAAERLEYRVTGVRDHLRRRAAIAVALWVTGLAGVWLLVGWLAVGADGWRAGSNVPALLDVLIVVGLAAGVLAHRWVVTRWLDEAVLSRSIEQAVGLRPGLLRGSLELGRSVPEGVSDTLATRAVLRTLMDLEEEDAPALAGELGSRVRQLGQRGLGFAGALAVALVLLSVAAPDRTAALFSGVLSPIETAAEPVLPPIVVSPGDAEVLRGTDVQLLIEAAGRTEVVVAYQAAGEVARAETREVLDGRAAHVFPSVGSAITYRVTGPDGFETDRYTITPIDPLFVSDLVLGVIYPPHTGIPPDEYRGDPPPLRLPVGTTLTFEGQASRPLESVALVDSAGLSVTDLQIDELAFSGAWRPTRDGTFDWAFTDRAGDPAEIQPEPLDILMVPDSAPLVNIPLPGRDTILPLTLQQPLILEARDDYGLRRIELVSYRVTAFGERHEPQVVGLDLGGTRAAMARPVLDVRSWGLLPGDTVRYFARAVDNGPAGQEGLSPEYVLRMPAATELQREAENALEGVADRLEELADEAARQAEENLERAMQANAERPENVDTDASDFEELEELSASLEDQRELTEDVDSLRSELESLQNMMEEAGQADPELQRQLEELQELLEQMNSEELLEQMEELDSALQQDDVEQANQSLEELAAQQEEFRQRLEESLERFKRAAVEQDFRATTSEAEELARQEQALADAMREEDDPELRAQQQEELSQRAEDLEQAMERLRERLEELGEQSAAEGVEEAQQRAEESREQMEQAQQQMSQGQNQQGGERAEQAAEQMEQAAQQLREAQAEMAQDQMEEQRDALLRNADDALALARRQNELREQMRGADNEQLARMRAEQSSLMQGLENMAENLQAAADGTAANPELSAQMGAAMEAIAQTLQSMEGRRGSTPSPTSQAESAIGELNQLAMMSIAGAEGTGQSGEGQSGQEVGEQLEQLAQQQGEMMNQSSQLMPMQLGQEAMAQQMMKMSEGQQSIAGDLGDLADEPGAEQTLGDLQEMAREAELLAQALAEGRLTPETVQRQERLFHRLLDAGRSLEREEFSEERESEEPGDFERGDVLPLSADQLGVLTYTLPDAAELRRLSPAVRQLVLEYFDRLNRSSTGRGGGG